MSDLIYVIEDDLNIREIIKLSLSSAGYELKLFDNAVNAIEEIKVKEPNLAIFDLMLPEMSGIDAIKYLRNHDYNFPILITSAKDREIDKVNGLDSGSDDYLTKPFGVLELQARVRTLLRRTRVKEVKMIEVSDLVIDKQKRKITKNDQLLELTKKEYRLLNYLIEHADRVVEREELLNKIWGYDFIGESRALDVHIRALRKKLDDDGMKYIKTIRGVGYRFLANQDED